MQFSKTVSNYSGRTTVLKGLNHCAENHDIFLSSFTAGFLTSMSKRVKELVILFLLYEWNTSPGRCSIFREQGKPFGERVCDFKTPECFTVHLKKADRVFSFTRYFYISDAPLAVALWFYAILVLSLAGLHYLSMTFNGIRFCKSILLSYAKINTSRTVSMLGNCTSVTINWDS